MVCTGYAVLGLSIGIELCRHLINKFSPLICDQDAGTSVATHNLFDNSMLVNKIVRILSIDIIHSCSVAIGNVTYRVDELRHTMCTLVGKRCSFSPLGKIIR